MAALGWLLDLGFAGSSETAPTVEAGGPYVSLGAGIGVTLDATVTPGSDPSPTYLWTVQSGGAGTWDDATLEDPTFTPTTDASSVLLLTVTASDTGETTDTAKFTAGPPKYRGLLTAAGRMLHGFAFAFLFSGLF